MSFVFEIGITEKNNKEIEKKETVEVIASKGIIGDRYFQDFNGDREQITLIESENIDYYNKTFNTNFNYLQFRRNIITKGIRLNDLIHKKIIIGNSEILGHQLCEPCLDLQKQLNQKDLVKNLLHKGGLRAEILKSGKISTNDEILIKD